jgi:uncharacterized protein (DUF1810 family)
MSADPFDLQRFVSAQDRVYPQALKELRAGQKRGHWIWFVLPQLAGLGHSDMAQRFGLDGLEEALAYLAHPVLGPRLRECVGAIIGHRQRQLEQMLGDIDALKFHSCVTLFAQVAEAGSPFHVALTTFFEGRQDRGTLRLLEQ